MRANPPLSEVTLAELAKSPPLFSTLIKETTLHDDPCQRHPVRKLELLRYLEDDRAGLHRLDEDLPEQRDRAASKPQVRDWLKRRLEEWLKEVDAPVPSTRA